VQNKRRSGLGRAFFGCIEEMLRSKAVKNIWLLSRSSPEAFWSSVGFRLTGEIDSETGQGIMEKSLKLARISAVLSQLNRDGCYKHGYALLFIVSVDSGKRLSTCP